MAPFSTILAHGKMTNTVVTVNVFTRTRPTILECGDKGSEMAKAYLSMPMVNKKLDFGPMMSL